MTSEYKNMNNENAKGLEGDDDSVTLLAQKMGFDKCPVCWTLVVKDAVLTECAHKFCEPCLSIISAQSFSFSCPSCRTMCLTVKTIPARKVFREIKQFTCPSSECSVPIMTLEEFDAHIRRECPSRLIKCDCGTLVKGSLYNQHKQTAHPKTLCDACGGEVFVGLGHLCPEEPLKCVNCQAAVRRGSLNDHLLGCPMRQTKCKSCGLPGPVKVICQHQNKCTLELCPYCSRMFRKDKLLHHSCHSKPVACPITECSFKGHYSLLERHMASHPRLYDTGIFSETEPTLYVMTDEKNPTEVRFARKITDYSNTMLVDYFGLGPHLNEIISKESPRVSFLSEAFTSQFSPASLHRLFTDLAPNNIHSLFTQGLLTHKEGEIISNLEIQYKRQFENFPSLGFSFIHPSS